MTAGVRLKTNRLTIAIREGVRQITRKRKCSGPFAKLLAKSRDGSQGKKMGSVIHGNRLSPSIRL